LAIPISKLDKVKAKACKLHCVLGGDATLINVAVGLQGCSASCLRCLCKVLLATLKKHERSVRRLLVRIRHRKGPKRKSKQCCSRELPRAKKEAKTNASFIRKTLIPVHFTRMLLAPLHIILGIMKQLWDELVFEIQAVNTTVDKQHQELDIVKMLWLRQLGTSKQKLNRKMKKWRKE
jgi:hypothetical protein